MTQIAWAETPSLYESGLDQGVLYLSSGAVPWNGLVSIEEKNVGLSLPTLYLDGNRRKITQETGMFEATIQALGYPKELESYLGQKGVISSQSHDFLGFSFRTQEADGYKLHLIYNAQVTRPSRKSSTSTRPSAEALLFDIHTTPVDILGAKPGSQLVIRTHDVRYPEPLVILEEILYGTDAMPPRLPPPDEVIELFESYTIFRITYNWDGTWTATGPDDMVYETEPGTFELSAETVLVMEEGAFQVSSY